MSRDPRQFVTEVDLEDLLEAWSSPFGLFALVIVEHEIAFPCPICGAVPGGPALGAAVVLDPWRWSCSACRFVGTRALLERLVLEDAARLTLLFELVDERRSVR